MSKNGSTITKLIPIIKLTVATNVFKNQLFLQTLDSNETARLNKSHSNSSALAVSALTATLTFGK
ncbi:hypothetical protein ACAG65_13475, partial [Halodesulfovibrio aestuarii]|uniref:hypothetical protein n=1 Tax=Halodesulfovibrio aestuarii TaxID=126333 RepID=UPI0035229B03